jgi:long-chain acyl-CoA synthetase
VNIDDSLLLRLFEWAATNPTAPAQAFKVDGQWQTISVQDMADRVLHLANFFSLNGIGPGKIGLIYSNNKPTWVQVDFALMLAGAASAGIYPNSSARQINYILQHSEAEVLIIDNLDSLEKLFKNNYLCRSACPASLYNENLPAHIHNKTLSELSPYLKLIVVLDSGEKELPTGLLSFAEALTFGRACGKFDSSQFLENINKNHPAVLIYTSGTTGVPKAVVLSHENLAFASSCYAKSWDAPPCGKLFSFLPLAHIAERITNLGIGITNRYAVYFCSNAMVIASELKEVQPTIALSVPRLWDKLKEGVERRIIKMPKFQQRLAHWAMQKAKQFYSLKIKKHPISWVLFLQYWLADLLVLRKIRNQLGLLEAKRIVSGAAALSSTTLEWYRGIGILIIEAYALSETSGVLSCGKPTEDTAQTVGVPYAGIELALAADGEIMTRGAHVFCGYFKDPLESSAMVKDGWLYTGDIGEFDSKGYLKILGRKREIIKNAEGKMISPLFIEAQLEQHFLVDQAIVVGNEKPYLVALITLVNSYSLSEEVLIIIQEHIDFINRDCASHERIKKFRILERSLSIEQDEITPTYKIKRSFIEKKFQSEISSMYFS